MLATLPAMHYNGPGMQLLLLGDIDTVLRYPAEGRYEARVVQGPRLIADAVARIRQAGRKYHLPEPAVHSLVQRFKRNAGAE